MPIDLRIAVAALALSLAPLAASAHHREGHGDGGGSNAQESRGGMSGLRGGAGLRGGSDDELAEMEEDGLHTYPAGPWHAGLEPFPDAAAPSA